MLPDVKWLLNTCGSYLLTGLNDYLKAGHIHIEHDILENPGSFGRFRWENTDPFTRIKLHKIVHLSKNEKMQ